MIKWLAPLGFLGLISLIALLLIYIIKPRYQQKIVASTVAWRILLKRKKKKIPMQPLRMIIIILCQIVALTSLAFIMAQPKYFSEEFLADDAERIVIVDGSGSMLAQFAGGDGTQTRFDRAKAEIKSQLSEWLSDDKGSVSLIFAGKEAQYFISDAGKDNLDEVEKKLDEMVCCYGAADVKGALELAEQRLVNNPLIKIIVYTGTDYGNLGSAVTVRNLANIQSEWNVAVLSCDLGTEYNEYVFHVNVGAYGKISKECSLYLDIKGAKNGTESVSVPRLHQVVEFAVDTESINYSETKTIKFKATDPDCGGREGVFFSTFEEATVGFEELHDSMPIDDSIKVYGGVKDDIKVQYYSTDANAFYYFGFVSARSDEQDARDRILSCKVCGRNVYQGV